MFKLYRFLIILILFGISAGFAFTNLGRDFYLCYPANAAREPGGDPLAAYNGMIILTSTFATTGTVRNWDGSWSTPFSIPPNGVTTVIIDTSHWISTTETIERKALRIQSDQDISAYFLAYETPGSTNDMALIYPVPSLGTEYITMCWRDNIPTWPYGAFFDRGPTMFTVFAPYDGTNVTITPSEDTEGGHTAGVPFTITLDSYECYQVLASSPSTTDLYDLTGSIISSDNPVGVISGNQIAIVPDEIVAADYLIEQMPPITAWGSTYNCFPIKQRNYWQEDVLKILASEDGTNVSIQDAGGTTNIVLNRGEDFEWNGQPCTPGTWLADGSCSGPTLDSPTRITADKPILCGQFIMGTGVCSRTDLLGDFTDPLGDPAFMLIPAEEQYSKRYIFLTPSGYNNDYLNVGIPAGSEGTITLDGGPPTISDPWFDIPGTSYRGTRISLEPGGHVLESDTTMMIQMYGFDTNWASYAAVAGQNLNPINAEFSIIKYCLDTPAYSGTQTTWRIVVIQNDGDPSTGLHIVDTLPPGFYLSADPPTIELFGTATRTSTVDPAPGDVNLDWGVFNTNVGDSIVITFTADIDFGVVGLFDNAVGCEDDSGNGITNGGGIVGHQDDCQVLLPAEPAAQAGDDTVICEGMSVTLGGYPAASGGVPPLTVSWTSDPPGFTSSEENPMVTPTEPTTYELVVSDSLGQADTDWVFIDIAPAPFADIIIPDPCGLVTSCEFQEFEWIIVDTTVGVLEESTVVNVNGTEYYPGGELTTTTSGDTTYVRFTPSAGWAHDETVYGELVQAMNEAYCWTSVAPCTFAVDLEPPIITDTIPSNGDSLFEASPTISLTIEDIPAGVDPTSFDHMTVYVDGVPVTGWTFTWTDPTLTFDGLTFTSGDTVEICLDSLYDAPGYDYCPPNDTSFCWEFYIFMTTPEAWITEPIDLNTDGVAASACTCQQVIFYLHDDLGIDDTTIILTIDGSPITISDPRLTLIGDTLIYQPTMPCWTEGTHTYALQALNIIGAPLAPPVSGDFEIDLSPPYFTGITPPPGGFVGASPTVSSDIYDDGLGLVEGDVYITIDGTAYTPGTPGIIWDGTNFEADLAALGLSYTDGDIINICLMGAHDNPDYCDSNYADTCWTLVVNLAAPIATVENPDMGTISACTYQGVTWFVEASNGIDPATGFVDDGSTVYDMTAPEMNYTPATATSGFYEFIPSVPWGALDWPVVCLYGVEDSMDHVMPDTVCAEFRMDLLPPEIYGVTPPPGTETPSTEPAIYFCLRDTVALLDGDSITLTVEGVPYTFGSGWSNADTCLEWNAVDWGVSFPESDTIIICVDAADMPDTCQANHLDTCWTLIMPPPSVHAHAGVDVNLCPGDSIQIGCSPTGYGGVEPYTYEWTSIPAGFSSSEPNPYVSPTTTTTYIVHVTDDAIIPTEDYDSITITVDFVPVTPPTLVSPTAGALIPPSPTATNLVWNVPGGTGSFIYDVIVDGAVVATDITDTTYAVDFPCGETHTWTIIAKNMCSSEYYYCTADTSGDSTYIWIDDPDTHFAVSSDSARVFSTYPCGGPVPSVIRPLNGSFTACDPESIIIQIDDTSGINESTIELEVDGTSYATSHAFLTWYPPNTLVFSPGAGFWSDGDIVNVSLLHAENSYGVDISSPLTFSFTVDYTPPTFSGYTPPAGGYAPGFVTTAGFHTEDALSGVDSTTVCITVDGPGYLDTYCVGDPCVTWDDAAGDFSIDLDCAGYDFARGDTITFCAIAGDSPDYCDANIDTSCWTIFIIDCDLALTIDIPDLILCGVDDSSFTIPATTSDGTPPYSFSWEPAGLFADPAVEDGEVSIVGPGAQYFTLTVTDSTGCAVRESVFIGMSNPIADAGNDLNVCPEGVAEVGCDPILSGSVVPPVDTSWYDMEGTLVHTGWPFIYSPTETDTFELVITDSIGCTSIDSVIVHYEHEAPGPFSWHSPEPDDTVDIGTVELCWEMPSGTTPIYFDVWVDGSVVISEITDTCYTVGPFPCGETHFWYIESYNYCYPIDCAGDTIWTDSLFSPVVVLGDSFAGGFDPPFHTEPCPTAIPVIIEPLEDTWSACDDQPIILEIDQPDSGLPIIESSIILEVEGTEYTVDGTILDWTDPTLTFTPPTLWTDGQEVDVCLNQAFDTDSNTVNDLPFCWTFSIDLTPPTPTVVSPPLVDQTSSPTTFEFDLTDAGCGVAPSSIISLVGNDTSPLTPYSVDGTILDFVSPSLLFDATAAGESWVAGDSIVFEIVAADTPDYCDPNIDTTHFAWFFRDPNEPVPTIIRPDSGDYTACDPDSIVLQIDDPDGIVESTIELIVNGTTYTTADAELTWNDPYLVFHPSPAWTDATVVDASLTHVEDIYGNDISSSVDWSFTVDLSAPQADMTLPIDNGMTSDREQDIEIDVNEVLSGVDIGATELVVNGVTYSDADFTWNPDGLGGGIIVFRPEEAGISFVSGDTVDVHLEIEDTPDWCEMNSAEFDWLFYLEPEVTCAVLPNPFTPDGNDINDRAMFTYPNMMSKPATIVVYDVKNIEIWRSEAPIQTRFDEAIGRLWDGRDSEGQAVAPGLYLYVVMIEGEVICNGTIVLLR